MRKHGRFSMNQTKISKYISIGVRVTALLLILFFFIPSICVSCQGAEAKVSGFNASIGSVNIEGGGEEMEDVEIDAAPWLFIILLLSIAIAVIANKIHLVSMICSFGGIVMMIVFKIGVDAWVEDEFAEYASYVNVETNAVYVFYIIFSVLIILALAFEKYILLNDANRAKFENILGRYVKLEATAAPTAPEASAAPAVSTEPKKFCPNCGKALPMTARFCGECGTALPSENNEAPTSENEQ